MLSKVLLSTLRSFRHRRLTTFDRRCSTTSLISAMKQIFPEENVLTSESSLDAYSGDESYHIRRKPSCVVQPTAVEQISSAIRYCNTNSVGVIAFGTGTGFEGGVIPTPSPRTPTTTLTIDLHLMDQLLSLNTEDFDCTVRPGVSRQTLNHDHLHATGLWFPIDPGADASICGMCATGASGTNAVRYGTMKENVLNLEVVLPNGEVIWTSGDGCRSKKTSCGYNLTQLFVGSEGTLGIITAATIKLYPVPECLAAAICQFPSVKNAVDCAVMMLQSGLQIGRVELLDEAQVAASNRYSQLNYAELPSLWMEFQGSETAVKEQIEIVRELANDLGGSDFQWAVEQEKRTALWKARHMCWYALKSLRPGCVGLSTDVCVPISALPETVVYAQREIGRLGLIGTIVGHVGDGNFHCFLAVDLTDKKEVETIMKLLLGLKALEVGGTCTGEHGIGLGKKDLLERQVGPSCYGLMKSVKTAVDPNGIMNPGKVFQ